MMDGHVDSDVYLPFPDISEVSCIQIRFVRSGTTVFDSHFIKVLTIGDMTIVRMIWWSQQRL